MVIDGKKLAARMVASLKRSPVLARLAGKEIAVCVIEPTDAIRKFIAQKEKTARELGLALRVHEYPATLTQKEFIEEIEKHNRNTNVCGIVVQLPLPPHLDSLRCFNALDVRKDIDVLSDAAFQRFYQRKTKAMPPVAGAIDYIVAQHKIAVNGSFAVVLGAGRLVGMPCLVWCAHNGADACSFREWGAQADIMLSRADIVIAGLGAPRSVRGMGLKQGVVVFDVGFSRENGKIVGDVDFETAQPKARYITPVPGGIGPLTVAVLFKNLVELQKEYK